MPVYDPLKSYPIVIKTCPDETTAPVITYPGPCPPPPWTNSAWYFNFPTGYSFCYHCAPGQFWAWHPDCNCCLSIVGNGSDDSVAPPGGGSEPEYLPGFNSEKLPYTQHLGSWNPPESPQSPTASPIPEGEEEPPFAGAAPPPPPPGTICRLYNSIDIWYRYTQDDAGNVSTTPIPDCYPATNPNQGCPVMPGQCFFWDLRTAQPVCVVERLLDYPTGRPKQARNLYYCSTCADPVAGPWSPNGLADHATWYGTATQPPDPWIVTSNPTQSICTDCEQVWNGNFHCLHPDDPMYNNPSTCIELSAGTTVWLDATTQNYYAINAPNYYQLAGNTIQGTLGGCELNCIGGCVQPFSAITTPPFLIAACNYDPSAAFDDGSCCFNFPCIGCGDSTATNYCPLCCTIDNTLCLYPGEGCMDDTVGVNTDINGFATCGPSANQLCEYCDYDPLAYISTPCCNVSGCMNGTCNASGGGYPSLTGFYDCGPSNNLPYLYMNYDPNACCTGPCCMDAGCMDPQANNYDPLACADDGSCIYGSWDCVGCPSSCACTDPGNGSGTHTDANSGGNPGDGLLACQDVCPPPSWDCDFPSTGAPVGTCTDPGNGSGIHSSLTACQAFCVTTWNCVPAVPGVPLVDDVYDCFSPSKIFLDVDWWGPGGNGNSSAGIPYGLNSVLGIAPFFANPANGHQYTKISECTLINENFAIDWQNLTPPYYGLSWMPCFRFGTGIQNIPNAVSAQTHEYALYHGKYITTKYNSVFPNALNYDPVSNTCAGGNCHFDTWADLITGCNLIGLVLPMSTTPITMSTPFTQVRGAITFHFNQPGNPVGADSIRGVFGNCVCPIIGNTGTDCDCTMVIGPSGVHQSYSACYPICCPSWDCSGPPNYACSDPGTGNGSYSSLLACEDYCTPTWNCTPCVPYITVGGCVLLLGGVGTYTSLAACNTACPIPPESWNCILGICSDPGCGGGTYSSLLACQAVCGAVIPCEPPANIQTAGDNSPDCDDTMTLLNSGISINPMLASEWALQNVPTVDWADMYFLGTQPISSNPPNTFCNDGTYNYNNNLKPSFQEPGGIYVNFPFHNSTNWANALNYLNTQYQTLGNGSQATTTPFNTSMNFSSIVQMMRDTCPFHTIDWEDGTSFLFIRSITVGWSNCHCTSSYGMEVCYDYDMWMVGTSSFPSLQALLLHWVNMYALPSMGGYILSTSDVQDLINRCCPPGPPPWDDWCPCNWR